MQPQTINFTVRIESYLLDKFRHVAEYNARSANGEIKIVMKEHIAAFENKHGKIKIDG